MGKSEEKQIKQRAHKATDSESKHKNKPSFDATNFEATNDEGTHHSQWCDHFRQLCEFKVQFGHCLVPRQYADNLKLGRWVATQRTQYKLHQKGKPSRMTDEHIGALDGVGFESRTNKTGVASSKTNLKSIWSLRLEQLCEFKVQFGHSVVPQKYANNPKLGRWVSKQRREYRLHQEGKPSLMIEERIRDLESIRFDWEASRTDWASLWILRIQQLCEFKVQFGHYQVPQPYAANPKLGQWVMNQRTQYRLHQKGEPSLMTEGRIRELESIGFQWETNKFGVTSIWSVRIQDMREFKEQFGHCVVPVKYSANPKLGCWASNQRQSYRSHQEGKPSCMTAERIRELESIGFDWGTSKTDLASIWSMRVQQLCEFKVQFGHYQVPNQYAANPKLGQWVMTQRTQYRLHQKGEPSAMTEGRIRELESIGFEWRTSKTGVASILNMPFQQLCEFKAEFDHCLVPNQYAANHKLGQWVATQRTQKKVASEGRAKSHDRGAHPRAREY